MVNCFLPTLTFEKCERNYDIYKKWLKGHFFSITKFDSLPELLLARVLETDIDVLNWLCSAPLRTLRFF